jgi:deoxycytidylate deaminase
MKQKYFDIAKRLAKKSNYHHQIGAVVVKNNRPIGFGFNDTKKTHPRAPTPYRTKHAEFDAVLGLSYDELNGAEIYVYRETKDGKPAMSKPCEHCQEMLKLAKICKMNYTSDKDYQSEEL